MDTLESFLKQFLDLEKVRELLYKFTYKGVKCAGIVSRITSDGKILSEDLSIRPMQANEDIGKGAGNAESVSFNYMRTEAEWITQIRDFCREEKILPTSLITAYKELKEKAPD